MSEEEEEEESDEVAQGGSSSHHKDNNNNNHNTKKQSVPAGGAQRPVLQRRFAVDPDNNHKAGVPIHHHPHPHPHEPHPPPPAVAAPACPPTITESRRGPTEGGSTTGVHRPLQRSATLPANPQRNVTLQLANKHRIVHFCNAVSNNIVCPFRFYLSLNLFRLLRLNLSTYLSTLYYNRIPFSHPSRTRTN